MHAHPRYACAPPGAPRGPLSASLARSAACPTPTVQPPSEADPGSLSWGHAGAPTRGHQDLAPSLEASNAGHPRDASGAASLEAYIPPRMDLQYASREGPGRFSSSGWVLGAHEAEALREPPQSLTETFKDNIHWV